MDEAFVTRGGIALSSKGAEVILQGAKNAAASLGCSMCITVVDAGGHLLAFIRTDGARLANIQMSMTKALSAVSRRRATADESAVRDGDPAYAIRTALAAGPHAVTAMSGGIPIFIERQLVGGIGVSGGSRHEDVPVAQAGIDALKTIER